MRNALKAIAISQATILNAVEAEITDPFPDFSAKLATPIDESLVVALAESYTAGLGKCDWERVIDGEVSPKEVLTGIAVLTMSGDNLVALQVYNPMFPPHCSGSALAVDMDLSPEKRLEAIFTGAIPLYRALFKLGWKTLIASSVPENVMMLFRSMGGDKWIVERVAGEDKETGVKVYDLEIDIANGLKAMEK